MSVNLIMSADALNAPLTGIGYYAAHLLDEFLKDPEFSTIRGINDQGLLNRTTLAARISELTEGELGHGPADEKSVTLKHPLPESSEHSLPYKVKQSLKEVPGAYLFARHWFEYRRTAALSRMLAADKGKQWLLHAPNYIAPPHDAPTVVTVHDLSHIRHPETHPKARIEYLNKYLPETLDRAEQIICVSEFTRQELLEQKWISDPQRISVCHNGLSSDFYPRTEQAVRCQLEPWDLQQGRYILSVATMEPRKNLIRLLEAYEALPDEIVSNFSLVLAGSSGWKSRELHDRIASLEPPRRVVVTGYVSRERLHCLLSGAAVFAYLSFYEGFGLPLLEAMASATPVLTSNTTSLAEVAGESGIQVDPLDVDAITDALERLLTDQTFAESFRQLGLKRAAQFSWRRCAEETKTIYKLALEQN